MWNSQAGIRGTCTCCSKETCHLVFSDWKVYSEMLIYKRTRTARICFHKYREKTNKQTLKIETCKSLQHLLRPWTLEMAKSFSNWYYVNSRRHVDLEKIRVPDGILTHDPPWSSRMLYLWATGDSVVSKGQVVGIDWNRIARLHSHVLAHMNSLTASRCHIKAYRDASNQPPK